MVAEWYHAMSAQNPETGNNPQLASLAREVEQLRLKQSQSPDSALLPAVQSPHPEGNGNAQAAQGVVQPQPQASRVRYSLFPFGSLLVIVFFIIAMFGGFVDDLRTGIQDRVIEAVGLNYSPDVYVQNRLDHMQGGAAANIGNMKALAAQVQNKLGASNPETYLVELKLADDYKFLGQDEESRKIWQQQLKYLDPPPAHPTNQLVQQLLRLSFRYKENNDLAAAKELFLCAERIYAVESHHNCEEELSVKVLKRQLYPAPLPMY